MQFALGAIERVLARVELAGGNLDRHAVNGGAVLTHQYDLAALGQCHNGRRTRMANDIAGAAVTVGQLNLKTVDVEDLALPGALLRKNLLVQLGIVRVVVAQHQRRLVSDLATRLALGVPIHAAVLFDDLRVHELFVLLVHPSHSSRILGIPGVAAAQRAQADVVT